MPDASPRRGQRSSTDELRDRADALDLARDDRVACNCGTTRRGRRCRERHVRSPAGPERSAISRSPSRSASTSISSRANWIAAASLVEEIQRATEATGSDLAPYGGVGLAALRGRETEAAYLIERDPGGGDLARRGHRTLRARLGRRRSSTTASAGTRRRAMPRLGVAAHDLRPVELWIMPEVDRGGGPSRDPRGGRGRPRTPRQRSLGPAARTGSWGSQRARRRCSPRGRTAEDLYREAIDRLARTRITHRPRARPSPLRRMAAASAPSCRRRGQLSTAHGCSEMGAEAFAQRAPRELIATGEKARKRTPAPRTAHRAGGADRPPGGDGLTNRRSESGSSALHGRMAPGKVFMKLEGYHVAQLASRIR